MKNHWRWNVNIDDVQGSPTTTDYKLWLAGERDKEMVIKLFNQCPVPDCIVDKVQVVYNPTNNSAFQAQLKHLQGRKGVHLFQPTWMDNKEDTPEEIKWRANILQKFKEFSDESGCVDPDFPDVSIVPLWHGTNSDNHDNLMKQGYAVLGTTDKGFFGKGVYSTKEAAYAYMYTNFGDCLILNWVSSFSIYPVIDKDFPNSIGKSNYGSYDTHWIPVIPKDPDDPNEIRFYPTPPNKTAKYTECVIFQTAQCLPRYLVHIKMDIKYLPLKTDTTKAMEHCKKGLELEFKGSPIDALRLYNKIMKSNYPPAFIRYFDCVKNWGYKKTIPFLNEHYLNTYFTWFSRNDDTYCLARCHHNGFGVAKDCKKAVQLYKKVVDKGDVLGYYWLGECYEKGDGVEKDEKYAIQCYKKAEEYPPAQSQLGFCIEKYAENLDEAFKCYFSAANKGHVGALTNVALFYEKGIVEEKNLEYAIELYEKAASQGQLNAQVTLGFIYEERGDMEKAKHYFYIATKQDHPFALNWYQELIEKTEKTEEKPKIKKKKTKKIRFHLPKKKKFRLYPL